MSARRASVLIMEDDVDLAEAWRRALESAGYDTVVALNVREAHALCNDRVFDLVISDLFIEWAPHRLEPEGGYDFITWLRSERSSSPVWGRLVPIVAITGSPEAPRYGRDRLTYAADLGANTVVRKPVTSDELVAIVHGLLR